MALLIEARPGAAVRAASSAEAGLLVRRFEPGHLGDPIASGRLSARLQAADAVVVVGAAAAAWALRELEGVPVHLVGGAAAASAATLAARGWSGELAYAPGPVLDFARQEGFKRLGVLHVAGYEGLLDELRQAAAARGVALSERRVSGARELPGGLRELAEGVDALWVLGDPLLTQGAGFAYLVEFSLSRRLPLIAPAAEAVAGGAYAGWEPDWRALGERGAAVAGSSWTGRRPTLAFGVAQGRVVVNEVLRRRWGGGGR